MTIVIIQLQGRNCPSIFCDHCGERITDANEAIVKYPDDPRTFIDILVCHKGKCDMNSIGGLGESRWPWMPLTSFFIYLSRSVDLDWDKANTQADTLASIH